MQVSTGLKVLHLGSSLSDALILKHLHPCSRLDPDETHWSHQNLPTTEEGPWRLVLPGKSEHRAVKSSLVASLAVDMHEFWVSTALPIE